MKVPSRDRQPEDFSDLPLWQRRLVRARWLLAGIHIVALAALFYALYFDGRLLQLRLYEAEPLVNVVLAIVFFAMQALLLSGAPHFRWPRPTRRRWMNTSIAAGSLMAALLTIGLISSLVSMVGAKASVLWYLPVLLMAILIPWGVWFFVFAAFWIGTWDKRFGRMYRLLLAGTWIELLVTIPVDIAVRRRTNCYCEEGTFFGMTIGLTMAFWTFGPGVVLLFFRMKRQREETGICLKCGYDLRGLDQPRCPECGTPFRIPQSPAPLQ